MTSREESIAKIAEDRPQSTESSTSAMLITDIQQPLSIAEDNTQGTKQPNASAITSKTLVTGSQPIYSIEEMTIDMRSTLLPNEDNPVSKNLQNVTLTEFPQFPNLPIELRSKIYSLAMLPRIIEIEYDPDHAEWYCPIESCPPLCGLYLANKESHDQYMRKNQPLFPVMAKLASWSDEAKAIYRARMPENLTMTCFFNTEIDTLYLGPPSLANCWTLWPSSLLLLKESAAIEQLRCLMIRLQDVFTASIQWEELFKDEIEGALEEPFFSQIQSMALITHDPFYTDSYYDVWGPCERRRPFGEIEITDEEAPDGFDEEVKSLTPFIHQRIAPIVPQIKTILRGGEVPSVVDYAPDPSECLDTPETP